MEKPMNDIREQIDLIISKVRQKITTEHYDFHYDEAIEARKQILKIKCSRGGGVCPECEGEKVQYLVTDPTRSFPCPTCRHTGQKPIVTKELREIIKEWKDGNNKKGY